MSQPPSRLVLIRAAAISGFPRAMAAGVLLFASSCVAPNAMTGGVQHAYTDRAAQSEGHVQTLSHNEHSDPFLNCEADNSCDDHSCEKLGCQHPESYPLDAIPPEYQQQQPIQQTSHVQQVSAEYLSAPVQQHCPSTPLECEPRQPLEHPAFCSSNTCPDMGVAIVRKFPEYVGDEYVCDGGDSHLPVHYNGGIRMGLDTEDTVAEYLDHTGEEHLKPSTKACVYAPRFAAVRTSTLPHMDYHVDRALGHQDDRRLAGLNTKLVLDEKVQRDEVRGMLMRARPSGVDGNVYDGAMNQVVAPEKHIKLMNAYEDIQFIRDGLYERANAAVVDLAIQAALEWTDDQHLRIIAHDQAGQQVQARFTAQDYTAYEDKRTKGDLKIIKVADKQAAHPGDEITFTIRFDNVGDRELLGVRIIDNLSPRLAFIEGSVESDFDGDLKVEDNTAGGQLLTFEFANQLPGKSGAYVSFKCRVR